MSDTAGSLIRHAAAAACLCLTLASSAVAQYLHPPGFAAAPAAPDLFTRTAFHLSAAKLTGGDERFDWDTHFGGEIDIFDYVAGRLTLLVDYEAVLGTEFRTMDPNQGNYTLEPSLSLRVNGTEVALAFHHVSRHLGDRAKRFPVDWNVIGARAIRRLAVAGATADLTVGAGRLAQHSRVDYRWIGDVDVLIRRPVNGRVGAFARATGETIGTSRDRFNRGRLNGGKLEAGVRLHGAGGGVELFAGVERRIDADPLDNQSRHWAFVGFRFVSR